MQNSQQIADNLTKELAQLIRTTVAETLQPGCLDKGDENLQRNQEIKFQDALIDYLNYRFDQ